MTSVSSTGTSSSQLAAYLQQTRCRTAGTTGATERRALPSVMEQAKAAAIMITPLKGYPGSSNGLTSSSSGLGSDMMAMLLQMQQVSTSTPAASGTSGQSTSNQPGSFRQDVPKLIQFNSVGRSDGSANGL